MTLGQPRVATVTGHLLRRQRQTLTCRRHQRRQLGASVRRHTQSRHQLRQMRPCRLLSRCRPATQRQLRLRQCHRHQRRVHRRSRRQHPYSRCPARPRSQQQSRRRTLWMPGCCGASQTHRLQAMPMDRPARWRRRLPLRAWSSSAPRSCGRRRPTSGSCPVLLSVSCQYDAAPRTFGICRYAVLICA